MPLQPAVISDAVARYERERDRYLKLAARVADIVRTEIVEANAIRAQVTSRAKSAKSFSGKLQKFTLRTDKAHLATVDAVFGDVSDLAGVRVAAYRAEDEKRIVAEIVKRFCGPGVPDVAVDPKDKHAHNPAGFYGATHCQVCLRDDELVGTYENLKGTSCEIQVCSMMAHVWNEVEHDIGYKQDAGGPQAGELGLLRALGFLTRAGDDVITQLLEANLARLEHQTGNFQDAFDLAARLRGSKAFPEVDLSRYVGQLFEELRMLELLSIEQLTTDIGRDRFSLKQAIGEMNPFNVYLRQQNAVDFLLEEDSSDVVLVLLLNKHAQRIEDNHPAGRGQGRPARIRSIATRYLRYVEQRNHAPAP
jgi:ppGpp synthetase/RelA/SpoT-type nucleotidyltranferase